MALPVYQRPTRATVAGPSITAIQVLVGLGGSAAARIPRASHAATAAVASLQRIGLMHGSPTACSCHPPHRHSAGAAPTGMSGRRLSPRAQLARGGTDSPAQDGAQWHL